MQSEPLEVSIYRLLKKYNYKMTTAESATGGMIASTLVNVPGISSFFEQGYVTYSDAAKISMIGVPAEIIRQFGVVSAETARAMAEGAARTAGCEAALSVTGVAGPDGGTEECPVGLVYIGCCVQGRTLVREYRFLGNREKIRESTVAAALTFARSCLLEHLGEKG